MGLKETESWRNNFKMLFSATIFFACILNFWWFESYFTVTYILVTGLGNYSCYLQLFSWEEEEFNFCLG